MGPVALFDKSFLEALNPDQAVWFDHFFLANVCPLFYVETRNDLAKEHSSRGTPEELVARIAYKFPDFSGSPNVHHATICTANLLGEDVPLKGQVILPRGCNATVSDRQIAILPVSLEAKAFLRWAQGDYEVEERQAATLWRNSAVHFESAEVIAALKMIKVYEDRSCSTLAVVRSASDEIMNRLTSEQQVYLAMQLLGVDPTYGIKIMLRFKSAGEPRLATFAPYVAFAMRVELFFHVAVHTSRMSVAQRLDLCYLFYLPFCQLFVSDDWVHKESAPLFLREDQEFVAGKELKVALKALNEHYSSLPESERNGSISQIAPHPPKDGTNLVTQLWDRHFCNWRNPSTLNVSREELRNVTSYWQDKIAQLEQIASVTGGEKCQTPAEELDALIQKRVARKRKASWWRVPMELRRPEPPQLMDEAFEFHGGASAQNVVGEGIEICLHSNDDSVSSMPGCYTYLRDGQLWVDCAPLLNRKHGAPMPSGAMIARSKDDRQLAAFVSPISELGLLVSRLWEEEAKRQRR